MEEQQIPDAVAAIERDGLALLPGVFDSAEIDRLCVELESAMTRLEADGEAIRSRGGTVYAARNVLEWYPPARDVWRRPALLELLGQALGHEFGLVRALYFDKPPERTWALPWHKDRTIAVADNRLPSEHFSHPTCKAGVPHVEASESLLARMVTLRIHLDDVTAENGPLKVLLGSHQDEPGRVAAPESADVDNAPAVRTILAVRGDVLAMRPLVTHASGLSAPKTRRHRRILHLEFAPQPCLPDGYRWHTFVS